MVYQNYNSLNHHILKMDLEDHHLFPETEGYPGCRSLRKVPEPGTSQKDPSLR